MTRLLVSIRNASEAKFEKVDITTSKLKLEIVKILKNEGFIKNFKKLTQEGLNTLRIFLKYDDRNSGVIHGQGDPPRRFEDHAHAAPSHSSPAPRPSG